MSERNEKINWQKFLKGDANALSHIYELYVHKLYAYGLKICNNDELVKDSIQDVFVKLLLKRNKITDNQNLGAYLFKSLRNKLMEELRTNRRKSQINELAFCYNENHDPGTEQHLIASEENCQCRARLLAAMNSLTPRQREAIYLKYTKGCSYDQIAEILKIDKASARTLVYRSLKQIKSCTLMEMEFSQ